MTAESSEEKLAVSIVVATYNSEPWLRSSLSAMNESLRTTDIAAEFVVVDDGSTDQTLATLTQIEQTLDFPLTVIAQENRGRFAARWAAATNAKHDYLLILDTRVITHPASMQFIDGVATNDTEQAWNGHVVTDPDAPLIGHFWTLPTYLFWSSYLATPRASRITPQNFDRMPKGTGFLFIPKKIFMEACLDSWPEGNARLVSDDTKVLRHVAESIPLNIDPSFSATYIPRTSFRKFISHSFDRGTLFVDSYAGTSVLRSLILIALAAAPPIVLIILLGAPGSALWWWTVGVSIVSLAAPGALGILKNAPLRGIAAYFAYILPFGCAFWAGIVRGLFLHRRLFRGRTAAG